MSRAIGISPYGLPVEMRNSVSFRFVQVGRIPKAWRESTHSLKLEMQCPSFRHTCLKPCNTQGVHAATEGLGMGRKGMVVAAFVYCVQSQPCRSPWPAGREGITSPPGLGTPECLLQVFLSHSVQVFLVLCHCIVGEKLGAWSLHTIKLGHGYFLCLVC